MQFWNPSPKRLPFTMIKNVDSNGSVDTDPYIFVHYVISEFSFSFNGERVPSEGLTLDMIMNKRLLWVIGYSLKSTAYITRTRD